jgi:hypothetical protein
MLFHGNMLYVKIHHNHLVFPPPGPMPTQTHPHPHSLDLCRAIALGDIMRSLKYEASMVVYSLVTGLPLLMTYSFFYNQDETIEQLAWKSTAASHLLLL